MSSSEPTRVMGAAPTTGAGPAIDPTRTTVGAPPGMLSLEALAGNRFALAPRTSLENALFQVSAPGGVAGRRMPVNLALVIDRSGSMEGDPLEYVKQACGYVVDLLETHDILSVVTFAETVDVVMPARRVVNRQLVKEHLQRIQVGNTTNLFDGLVAGAAQVASVRADGYLNRMLVLTDGEPTAGVKDFSSIVGCVGEQKTRGITTTALGFGPDYNEELLAGIARRSGGNYYYISRPELIPEVFRKEMDTLLTLTAQNLRLKLFLTRWTQVRRFIGNDGVIGGRTAEVELPEVERGATVSALAELELARRPAGVYRVARAVLTYDNCITGVAGDQLAADLVVEFVTDASLLASGVNPLVRRELEVAQASRDLERTMMGIKTHQLGSAAALADLERTQVLLQRSGRSEQAAEVTQAIQDLKKGGGDVEKTLIGTIMDLDLGKR